jgi:outer membrane protein
MPKALLILSLWLAALPAPAEEPQPLRYAQVVPLALQRNLALQSQAENVDMARSRVDQAEAQRNPTLGISSNYVIQDSKLLQNFLPQNNGQLMLNTVSLQIPIYTGGRLESAMHEKRALLEVEQSKLERVRQELAFRSKQTYLQALLARENEEVARQTLSEAQETQRQASTRKKAGLSTRFDVLQSQVAVSNAQQQVVQSHTLSQSTQANLASLLHFPVDTRFDMADSLMAPAVELEPLVGNDLKSLTVLALDRRPELSSLRSSLRANEEATNGARAGMKPQFNLALNYAALGQPTDLSSGWQVLAQVSIPLFDGGLSGARVDELEHRKRQLELDQEHEVDQIALQVKQSLLNLEDAEAHLETARRQVDESAEAVRLGRLRFKAGVGTSLELVTAQANYSAAQYALADARYRQMAARAQLNLALGVV